ncbi:hypothetical protein NFI96_014242, partial [Prochilodus magdalenae]
MSSYGANNKKMDQRHSVSDKQPPKEASGAPPALTAPLFEYWFFSQAYRRELSRIEKELGVRINAEVLVSVTAVDQTRQDSVNTATQRVTDLYQTSMKSLRCATVPLTHLESETPKLVRNIQTARDKMMMNVSESQCLLIGPEPKLAELERQMTLGPDVELQRSLTISTSNKVVTNGDLRGAAGSTKAKEEDKVKEDDCPICMDKLTVKKKLNCGHEFCRACLNESVKSLGSICPVCKNIFGKLVGNQPDGTMTVNTRSYSLSGYPHCGTIEIVYSIPDGIQTDRHPNPGRRFSGTTRRAYLPDNVEGRRVQNLLRKAFDQKLIFTVGTSSTTGLQNVIIWNDIHHKTSITGGPQ